MRKMVPFSLNFVRAAARESHCWQGSQNQGKCLHQALRLLPAQPKHNPQILESKVPTANPASAVISSNTGCYLHIFSRAEEWENGDWFALAAYLW